MREIDILEDKKAEDPTHRLQNRDLMRLVTRGLNRNERLIIILYYYEDMTMKEIGATLDLSESRVSQMHSSIVARLQAQLAAAAGIQQLNACTAQALGASRTTGRPSSFCSSLLGAYLSLPFPRRMAAPQSAI